MNWLINIYWKVGAFFIVLALIIHYIVVLPFLTKRGSAGIISWATNLRHGGDLQKYREYCAKEGKPLTTYKFLSKIDKFIVGWLVGWIVLILLSAIIKQ